MSRFVCCAAIVSLGLFSSCIRNSSEAWEDLKTAGRYMGRSVDSLCGKEYESRMLTSDEEFIGPYDDEFIPLRDSDLQNGRLMADTPLAQPKGIPGQKGVPSLADFYLAPDSLQNVFRSVHFETDEYVVKEKNELQGLMDMASYLKKHPSTYLVVEGHADERASASYNMALGMRRANYVRSFLVKQGIDQNRIYTISYGKEKPIALGHSPDQWKMNRRSEFKIFEK